MKQLPRMPKDESTLQLLADRATEGLSPRAEDQLASLLGHDVDCDADALEYAAAMVYLAFHRGRTEPLPARLRERLRSAVLDG